MIFLVCGDIILDKFFIRFSDLLINFIIGVIDFIISFINKFSNREKNDDGKHSKDENNYGKRTDFNNWVPFKIGNFLKNDSIFE